MSSDRAALAALAGEVEALRRQVDIQQRDLVQAQESADHAHRVVVEIVDRVKAIADRQAAPTGCDPAAGAPASWLSIKDPASARVALAELADWLTGVYVHYPGSLDSLGECWPWHPAVVEELLAVRGGWLAAYTSPDASAARVLDWHDRHLPGVQRRLRTALGDCSLAAHHRGGRADQLRPTVPAVAALDQLAHWWTASHGTTGAPPPTPDLDAQQGGTRHG